MGNGYGAVLIICRKKLGLFFLFPPPTGGGGRKKSQKWITIEKIFKTKSGYPNNCSNFFVFSGRKSFSEKLYTLKWKNHLRSLFAVIQIDVFGGG